MNSCKLLYVALVTSRLVGLALEETIPTVLLGCASSGLLGAARLSLIVVRRSRIREFGVQFDGSVRPAGIGLKNLRVNTERDALRTSCVVG